MRYRAGAQCEPCRAHHFFSIKEYFFGGGQSANLLTRLYWLISACRNAVVTAPIISQAYHHYRASFGRSVYACRAHHSNRIGKYLFWRWAVCQPKEAIDSKEILPKGKQRSFFEKPFQQSTTVDFHWLFIVLNFIRAIRSIFLAIFVSDI